MHPLVGISASPAPVASGGFRGLGLFLCHQVPQLPRTQACGFPRTSRLPRPRAASSAPGSRGFPWTGAPLAPAPASSCGPRWLPRHRWLPHFQALGEPPAHSGPLAPVVTDASVAPGGFLSTRLSGVSRPGSPTAPLGYCGSCVCTSVDSEARPSPLVPGAWLAPVEPN